MDYWKIFWQNYRAIEITSEADMLYQVGLTVKGKPISTLVFDTIINDVIDNLQLNSCDIVLDLCCGNGLITSKIAGHVQRVVGVDFSQSMLSVANKLNLKDNILYLCCDLRDELQVFETLKGFNFSKILMYGSLAYFDAQEFQNLLMLLKKITSADAFFFIGGVLDAEKKYKFYKTISLKLLYLYNSLRKKDPGVGRWYGKKEMKSIAEKCGYNCQIISQKDILHTAHYRFDVILTRRTIHE